MRVCRGLTGLQPRLRARAGRTLEVLPRHQGLPAHPRSCRVDRDHSRVLSRSEGSSPLVPGGPNRGERKRDVCLAHPRSRGADRPPTCVLRQQHGSSPLARGGLPKLADGDYGARLIPARAGRTVIEGRRRHRRQPHPRSRGADWVRCVSKRASVGSSPLARGGPGERYAFR